ncbi:MAG: glycerol-3-phosphate dehydrogenase/oxidase [Bacteroidetes bacterium]|nr:glycerol-3-phosphate dehydrogenase/oxidase [Bacteroidota bacterium]
MQKFLASTNRADLIEYLTHSTFDLLIIGGGATGAGIALDASSRGMKVALIDKQDFAAGTSSRSTKLIHGGLRYLKQLEIGLVREVGRERATVHHLAPHLVVSEKMLLPLIKGGTYGKFATSLGLMVYDVLAGVESADQRVMLTKEETMDREPLLKEEIVEGAGLYAEYRTDDARLTLEVIKTSSLYGSAPINYVEATDFLYENDRVTGASCKDLISGQIFDIHAVQVVSAAGPWVDELRTINKSMSEKRLHLTKGVHIVIPHEKLPVHQSVYFDVPDGRMVFAIPRGRITYVGTTDTDYKGDKENPLTNQEDVEYLVNGINNTFPSVNLTIDDVISSWAGLRPLIHEEGKSASELSRKDEIFLSDTKLLSIAGGKLTGYRKMAERVVDVVAKRLSKKLNKHYKKVFTNEIIISGGGFKDAHDVEIFKEHVFQQLKPHGFSVYDAHYLVHNYGQQTDTIIDYFFEQNELNLQGLIKAELWFGINFEMVNATMDFFSRRTGRLYFDIESVRQYKDLVIGYLAKELSWDHQRIEQENDWVQQAITLASHFPPSEKKA